MIVLLCLQFAVVRFVHIRESSLIAKEGTAFTTAQLYITLF